MYNIMYNISLRIYHIFLGLITIIGQHLYVHVMQIGTILHRFSWAIGIFPSLVLIKFSGRKKLS